MALTESGPKPKACRGIAFEHLGTATCCGFRYSFLLVDHVDSFVVHVVKFLVTCCLCGFCFWKASLFVASGCDMA